MNLAINDTINSAIKSTANTSLPTSQELPLADIHLPATVSAWPPAIGWWLLVIATITVIILCIFCWKRYRKKWAYRNTALRLLKQHYNQTHADNESLVCLQTMQTLLKRTAITAYPQQNIQALYGQAWIDCLNRQTKKAYFTADLQDFLLHQQYQVSTHQAPTDTGLTTIKEAFYRASRQWIKQHHSHYQEENT